MLANIIKSKSRVLIPKLRFVEFSDAWETKTIGEICTSFKSGESITSKDIFESGLYPVYGGNGIRGYSNNFTHSGHYILIGRQGALCGNINRVSGKSYISEHAIAVSGNTFTDTTWLAYKLELMNLNRLSESSAQPGLAVNKLVKLKISLPSLSEQQKIASFLSAVDEKIQLLTRKKELLEQYKKGVMQQLFSGKLRFKPSPGEPVAEDTRSYPEWEEKRLGDVGEIVSGLTYSPNDVNAGGILVLRSSNVQDRQLTFDDNIFVKVSDGDFNPVKENDILICVRNGSKNLIGKNVLITKEVAGVAFGAFMTVYRSKYNLFLYHYFDSVEYKKEVNKNLGATINSINGSDLKKFKIPFPSETEQNKIAELLNALDKKIKSLGNQISETQTFKKGLLQQMFV